MPHPQNYPIFHQKVSGDHLIVCFRRSIIQKLDIHLHPWFNLAPRFQRWPWGSTNLLFLTMPVSPLIDTALPVGFWEIAMLLWMLAGAMDF